MSRMLVGSIVMMDMEMDNRPAILQDLWTGESVWCVFCGHHVNCHNTVIAKVNNRQLKVKCNYNNGYNNGICNCRGFEALEIEGHLLDRLEGEGLK